MAGSLDRDGQSSLVLGAIAGDTSGQDLAALGDVLSQLAGILIVDTIVDVAAEHADFLSSAESAFLSEAALTSGSAFIISHGLCSFLDQANGSSSSMPSGIFMKPSPADWGAGEEL